MQYFLIITPYYKCVLKKIQCSFYEYCPKMQGNLIKRACCGIGYRTILQQTGVVFLRRRLSNGAPLTGQMGMGLPYNPSNAAS